MAEIIAYDKEQEEEKDTKPVTLKLITGGKDGGDNGGNWLSEMEVGTLFLCRKIKGVPLDNPFYEEYQILQKTEDGKAVQILADVNGQRITGWVNPMTFSTSARFVTILGKVVDE